MLDNFQNLNNQGKLEAVKRVGELTEIDKYVLEGLEETRENLNPKDLKFPDLEE